MKNKIDNVAVIGSGTMGSGIVQLIATHDINIILLDISNELLMKSVSTIEKNLGRLLKKGQISESDLKQSLSRIKTSTSTDDLENADLVIEAVSENLALKKEIFTDIDGKIKDHAIIASNTSTLPIIELAMSTSRPDRVIGIHFFNPAPIMKLVEIINSIATSESTTKIAYNFTQSIGKQPVITKDSPGFIVNRILFPMLNEAVFALSEDLGNAEDIDNAMKLGTNQPIGPLALIDLIGLDVSLDILDTLFDEFKDSKYRAAPLLRQMVRAGKLGKKSGSGFFNYDQER